jgi:BlaI family penicillinase repressor
LADRPKPSDVELQVLSVLWRDGPLTARQVLERLPDGKERAYTTVLTTLQVMEKKKLVTHERNGVAHVYSPIVKQNQVLRPLLRGLIDKVFGGSAATAMQHLLREADVNADELSQIRQMLDEHDSAQKKTGRGK